MALIPLKQRVTVIRAATNTTPDMFGNYTGTPTETEYKCRIDEGKELVATPHGDIVDIQATIWFAKEVDIRYTDQLRFTMAGQSVTRTPKNIEVIRGLNGKALFTVVYV